MSVRPSGPVPEDTDVALTCSCAANPAVKNYTWYRADRSQETVMGTGHVLNIKASRDSGPFFCEAENAIGSGRSNISQIDVHCKYHKWSLVSDVNYHRDLSPFVHRLLVTNFN